MKKVIFIIYLLVNINFVYSNGFGFSMEQESIFIEENEYYSFNLTNLETNLFYNYSLYKNNFIFSLSPNICIKDEKLYFNLYKLSLQKYYNNVVFSLNKNIFYYGKGYIKNLSIPQILKIQDKDKNNYYAKIDYSFCGNLICLGSLIDKNIDYYKKIENINPFFIYTFNNDKINLTYTIDYLINLEDKNHSLKNAIEAEVLTNNDFSIYSSCNYLSDFENSKEINFLLGFAKPIILNNYIFSPCFEANYEAINNDLYFLLNLHTEMNNVANIETGLQYLFNEKLNLNIEANFYLNNFILSVFYKSFDLLKKENGFKNYLSIGVKYEL